MSLFISLGGGKRGTYKRWICSIHIREHVTVQEAMISSHDEMNSPYSAG